MKRILVVFLTLAALLSLTGCSSKPQPVFENYMAALQKGDIAKAKTYLTADAVGAMKFDENNPHAVSVVTAWFSKMKVSNVKTVTNGDTATVSFDMAAPDLKTVSQEVVKLAMQDKLAEATKNGEKPDFEAIAAELLVQKIKDPNVKVSEQSGTATLKKTDKGWKISVINVNWSFQ